MALSQQLNLKQTQQLVMTPQLQLAIRMLQMTSQELSACVAEEIERNPLLRLEGASETASPEPPQPAGEAAPRESENIGRMEEPFDTGRENLYDSAEPRAQTPRATGEGGDFTDRLPTGISLRDHLREQIAMTPDDGPARMLAALLVDELDAAGYLRADLDRLTQRLGADAQLAEQALKILQSCEPTGVGARDLAECLALQLRERDRFDPAMALLLERLDDLAALRLDALGEHCGVDRADIIDMAQEIRALDPRPGAAFDPVVAQTVIPDVHVRRNPLGGWSVEVNADALPRVLLDTRYAADLNARGETEATSFVADCKRDANWLIRALDQRAQTILKVASEIVRQQHLFFEKGVAALRPMTLRAVADEIGMHESTVSRVTSNKYMATAAGLFELKFFFTQAISSSDGGDSHSSESVRHKIKYLIDNENSGKTLSDDRIVKILKDDGVNIARRTVAKYREAMNIPSSVQRRRLKAAALS